MKNLQELDLSDNGLIGTLDTISCLGNLISLQALDLSSNQLSGSISSSFVSRLTSLEYLSLSDNNFEGIFSLSSLANHSKLKVLTFGGMQNKNFQVETENPPWIPSFQLQYLKMANCQVNLLTRAIPTFLSYQHDLRYIDLSNNKLVGRFPTWLLVNNTKLGAMFLNDNSLTGSFLLPSDYDEVMDYLYMLDISHNKIQDKLPKTMGFFFPHLEYLNASSNVLDGDIPTSIGDMSNLRTLDLAYNNFSGEVPNDILMGCILLEVLILSNNSLQGQIFPTHVNMRSLRVLKMDNNHFDGTLQDGLLNMNYLKVLAISSNKLSGKLPSWIGNLTINFFSASGNDLEGAIPEELCYCEVLKFVSLSHNRFSGAIPSCFGKSELQFIHLQNNNLTGITPKALLSSSELVSLDLGNNKIFGSIPKSVNGLENLKFLSLAGNQLQGQLPSQICELKILSILDISRNNFTGSMPICLNNISFGSKGYYYDFLYNYFSDFFFGLGYTSLSYLRYQYPPFDLNINDHKVAFFTPEGVEFTIKSLHLSYKGAILNNISGVDLSCNQLSGHIPKQIGDLNALHALNLSHNYLNGSIPESLHELETIESLYLSFNNLCGEIPLQLQDLNFLSVFNVSYNNLSGRALDKGQFATFDDSSYKGNPYLSYDISNRGIATSPLPAITLNDGENNSAIDFTAFYCSFGVSYVMVLVIFVIVLWINPCWRIAWFYSIEECLYKCFGQFLKDVFY